MNLKNCIITANVNGLKSAAMADKIQCLTLKLSDFGCDVACLLDTRLDESTEQKLGNLWDGDSFYAHGADCQSGGIAFLIPWA